MTDVCDQHSGLEKLIHALHCVIQEKEEKNQVQFNLMDRALQVAKQELDKRLEGMNEFRAALSAQALNFATKVETDSIRKELHLEVEKRDIRLNNMDDRIRALGHLEFEKRGEKKIESYLVTVMISAAVMLLFHYLFKF